MKQIFKRLSLEWFVEVTNLTNHKNVWQKFYNASRGREEYVYQYPIMPGGGVRFYFLEDFVIHKKLSYLCKK